MQTTPSCAITHSAVNGNSPIIRGYLYTGTIFAPMQGAYVKKAKVHVKLKMQTMPRCRKGTYEEKPANYPFWCNYEQRRQWKFSQIRGYFYTGKMFLPMKGAYKKEAEVLVNQKMRTMFRCKKRTYEDGQANYPFWCNHAQRRQWKFAHIRGYLNTGKMFPALQGAYEKEAEVVVNLKMQTMPRSKKGSFEDGTAN